MRLMVLRKIQYWIFSLCHYARTLTPPQRGEAHDVPGDGIARVLPYRRLLTGFQSVPKRYALYGYWTMWCVFSLLEPCALAGVDECPRSGGAIEEISS